VRLGTPEWLLERRGLITGTDIPVLLGLSRYKSEAQLADEKQGLLEPEPANAAMRLGLAVEGFIADEVTLATGWRLRRVNHLLVHPTVAWAAASLDREVVGERRIVEIKSTSARWWDDGLPQEVEAQVRWQLGVTGYPVATVAAWVFGAREPLRLHTVEHDAGLFADLLDLAADFRRRMQAGGPFSMDKAYLSKRYPADDGTALVADDELAAAVASLNDTRTRIDQLERTKEVLEAAIQARMGAASVLTGVASNGTPFRCTWRQTKSRLDVDWKAVANAALEQVPEEQRMALVVQHSTARSGLRPFRVLWGKEAE
jgi:putative phage-type endonuclease